MVPVPVPRARADVRPASASVRQAQRDVSDYVEAAGCSSYRSLPSPPTHSSSVSLPKVPCKHREEGRMEGRGEGLRNGRVNSGRKEQIVEEKLKRQR